jgi:hypothetical protein
MNESSQSTKSNLSENLWVNMFFNLLLPILILKKGDEWFGQFIGNLTDAPSDSSLVASILLGSAVLFPVSYGVYDFIRRKKCNILSVLGAVSTLLTGGIGLVPGGSVSMFAIKEAALPGIIGILIVVTLKTKNPLVKMFLFNPDIFDVDKIRHHLEMNHAEQAFNRLLAQCTWLLVGAFGISSILNYILARIIVVTEPFDNKSAFNDEIGVMMMWSFPVISAPCMVVSVYAILKITKGIHSLTGLTLEDITKTKRTSPKA